MIRVFVVEPSSSVRAVLKEIIFKSNKLEWLGETISFDILKSVIKSLKPDVIITDRQLYSSEMKRLSAEYKIDSIPAVVYYSAGEDTDFSSRHVSYVELPDFISFKSDDIEKYSDYLEKLVLDITSTSSILPQFAPRLLPTEPLSEKTASRNYKAVVVGVSTGGPAALHEFLKGIGKNFPIPILITQHIDSFFDKNLISWLSQETSVPIHLAESNIKPLPGHVYFAPSDEHLTLKAYDKDDFFIMLNHDAPVNFIRPAVDKMFESAAEVLGGDCIAVILTGMGADGAKGCLHLKKLGAYTITQDESSCVIYGMPKAAYEIGASCEVLPLRQIPERLRSLTKVL